MAEELSQIKAKLMQFIRMANEIKDVISSLEKAVNDKVGEKTQVDNMLAQSQEKYNQFATQSADYWKEFEEKKKAAQAELEAQKKEAASALTLANQKLEEHTRNLESSANAEKVLRDKLVEVEKIKSELQEKREKAKSLISQI